MTTIKRIVAILLAVMLLASIGILTSSAVAPDGKTLTVSVNKDGFKYTVYKIADLVKADGKIKDGSYTCVSDEIKAIVDETQVADPATERSAGKVFRDELDALYKTNPGAFGTAYTNKVEKGKPFTINEEGIYYAVLKDATDKPATYTKANNVVIVWPEYKNNTWTYDTACNLSSKVDSGADSFDKYYTKYDADGKIVADKAPKFMGLGDTVSYTLEAGIVGSAEQNLQSFVFTDDMSAGLTYTEGSMKIYYGKNGVIDKSVDLLAENYFKCDKSGTTVFTITALAKALNDADFYDLKKHDKVYVQFDATVNSKAVIGKAGNPNTGSLSYTNASGVSVDLGPETVTLYTFKASAVKKNGSDNSPLKGAKFQIYKGSTVYAYGTSDDNGNVVFREADNDSSPIYRFAPGTYSCKETYVPDGFALSSVVYEVVIPDSLVNPESQADSAYEIKVNNGQAILNYPVKLPETGGAGTLIFTIIGGCLVLAAGIMFVIIMKKRSSSK